MLFPEKILQKLHSLPNKPGCYLMRDARGQIIYVGKAASLRRRLADYFRPTTLRYGHPKLRGLIHSIADFDFIVLPTEESAALMEGKLIKDYRPRYNTLFKDDKRFPLLRIDLRQRFPMFRLCRIKRSDGAEYFGPYVSGSAARAALEFIEKHFGLRRCTALDPGPEQHRHCLDDVLRFCSAPCINQISPEDYQKRAVEACAFLRGERPCLIENIRADMQAAALALNFEKAAALRDTLDSLHKSIRRYRLTIPNPIEDIPTISAIEELRKILEINNMLKRIEAYDISNISGTYAVGSLIVAINGKPSPKEYRRFRIRTITSANDVAMLAEVISRRFSRLIQEHSSLPDLILVDGGLPQLRAARKELIKLGLKDIPLISLAKRFEEIYKETEEGVKILRLSSNSSALLLLRKIRDEAHRFALTYHQRLRAQCIRESILDEIPGIGFYRKCALLKNFGSIKKLQLASIEEISDTPGIGVALAKQIHDYLSGAADKNL